MRWHTKRLSICDDNYRSNWPDFMSDEQIRALADDYAAQGQLDAFYREYRNIPIAKETASFKGEYFQYYEEEEGFLSADPHCESVVLLDPAKTVQMQSDFTAIVGATVNVVSNTIYVRDIVAEKLYPEQIYREVFAMAERIRANVIGIEVTSLHEFIMYPLKTYMTSLGRFYQLVELHARKSKAERVASLVPFYRTGQVKHNKRCCGVLETQLLWFPKSKRWDVMDALAYIVALLEEGGRYFQPKQSQMADEFKGLVYDEPLERSWRAI